MKRAGEAEDVAGAGGTRGKSPIQNWLATPLIFNSELLGRKPLLKSGQTKLCKTPLLSTFGVDEECST